MKGEIIQTSIIMQNYETMLVIVLGNVKIHVEKSKKSENNSSLTPMTIITDALHG